ncbi:MAG: hypothetical protein J7556_11090 [Acidovorax sp.]|nr:hypothetical protein [Acidovorax sp.]
MSMPAPIAVRPNEAPQPIARNGLPHVTHGDCDGGWDVMPLRCQGQHVAAHPVPQGFALGHGAQDWDGLPALRERPCIRQLPDRRECPPQSVRQVAGVLGLRSGLENQRRIAQRMQNNAKLPGVHLEPDGARKAAAFEATESRAMARRQASLRRALFSPPEHAAPEPEAVDAC